MEEVGRTGKTVILVNGKATEVREEGPLRHQMQDLIPKVEEASAGIMESGVFFLMPPKVSDAYENLLEVVPIITPVNQAQLELFRERVRELRETLATALGMSNLV